jgi:hypothetical protein
MAILLAWARATIVSWQFIRQDGRLTFAEKTVPRPTLAGAVALGAGMTAPASC